MAKQNINVGTAANDKKGDSLRAAFQKVNANFTELYTALGLNDNNLNLGAFEFVGSVMTTTDSTAIVIDQAVTVSSDLTVGGDIVPSIANGGNLGNAAKPWRSLYVSNSTIYIGGNSLGIDNDGELVWNNNRIAHSGGEFITLETLTDVNLGSPQNGDVLSYTGGYWTAATVDRLVNGAHQLELVVSGVTSYISFPENNGANVLIQGSEISVFGDEAKLSSAEAGVRLSANATATNGPRRDWTFGTDGALTIPGDIKSNGNINIDINLADSTLRRWQFGEDGDLRFPDGATYTGSGLSSFTLPTVGSTASAGEAGITYLTDPFTKWAIFTEGAFTVGVWTDVQVGWTVTDNNGFTDIIAGRGSFGAASFQTTVNNWPSPASGKTYVFTSPGYQQGYTDPIEITVGSDDWTFSEGGDLTLPDDAVIQTTSGNLTIEAENYVIIDSSTDGQIEIGRNSGVGAAILGNKSRGTNAIVDSDLMINNGVYEKFSSLVDATGTVTHNCSNGHIFYHTSPDANWTVNLTNLNSIWDRATSVTLIIAQGGTGYYPNALQIAGAAQTINWQGNVNPTPSTNRTDVVTFSIINNSGTYTVLGQLTGF